MRRNIEIFVDIDINDYLDDFWAEINDDEVIEEFKDRDLKIDVELSSDELTEQLCGKMSLTDANNFREYINNIILKK